MKKLILSAAFIFVTITSFSQLVYKDVAPIFYARCTSCHNQASHGPSYLNYSQTLPWIFSIQADLNSGRMPPWTPDSNYTRFQHEHTITPSEKSSILSWIAGGAVKGDTTLAPTPPVYSPYQLHGTPNLELSIPTFTSNAGASDSYVCFSLPTGLTQDRILRAYEIIAGNPSIVHHVVVNVDTNGVTTSNLAGNCYQISGDFSIGGFAPGAAPTVFPGQGQLKMGIRLKAGCKLVLQLHYPSGTVGQVDSTKIRLYFYPLNVTGVRNVYVPTPLQNWGLSIPANTVKSYTMQYPASGGMTYPISVFATFPHSHKIAKSIINYAYVPGDTIPLIRINNWDFNQQGYYTFNKLVKVNTGYSLFSKHVYDNTTSNPNNPNPINVTAGVNTSNEMFFDSFQWLLYQPGDELIDIKSLLSTDTLYVASVKENSQFSINDFKTYAFPNPFENSVRIGYTLDRPTTVSIEIYSIVGSKVKSLSNSFENSGVHEISWDGKNDAGINLPGGTYLYIVRAGGKQCHGKLSLLPSKN